VFRCRHRQIFIDLHGIGMAEGKTELLPFVGNSALDSADFKIF